MSEEAKSLSILVFLMGKQADQQNYCTALYSNYRYNNYSDYINNNYKMKNIL